MEEGFTTGKQARRSPLTGGLILITLGLLIILAKTGVWSFSQSWPVLLLVIALGTLLQRPQDLVGWLIGGEGLIISSRKSGGADLRHRHPAPTLLLILVGIRLLMRHSRGKRTIRIDRCGCNG
jgi:hypothetical protein